jgi:Mg-chelatase subunit ChlD
VKHAIEYVRNTKYGGWTNTPDALKIAVNTVFRTQNGLRENSDGFGHLAIVLTDGYSNMGNLPHESSRLKAKTAVFSIGVGDGYNESELQMIASETRYVYHVGGF